MNLTPTIALHLSAALTALTIGPIALWARKGREQRPRLHRMMGYTWVIAMLITAASAFFIRDFRLPNINGFTFIHALIPWVVICLCAAFWFLKQGHVEGHRKTMTGLYWGACVGAGLFTLMPGRYLGNLVWGTQGNTSIAPRPLLDMVSPIISRTPVWVWGLLTILIVLGLSLAGTRVLSLKRLVIVPLVMLGLSLFGTVSATGLSFVTVTMWLMGYAALVFALSRSPAAADAYNVTTQRFTVTGSYAPLLVMIAIFLTKYAVGVMQGMSAPIVHSAAFPVVIAALYGVFSGFFAGRALRVLKLGQFDSTFVLKQLAKPLLKTVLFFATVLMLVLGAALSLGGPSAIAPLSSINQPFASVDYSAVPPTSTFTARDGAALVFLHYPANVDATPQGRVVLVHGSSAHARSMHIVSQGLSAAGFTVDALDMRGHGGSGERGHIAYIGQLEDDIADFMHAVPQSGRNTLMGFSSGGGFVLRFAGSTQQSLFSDYVLLSPYLKYDAPTAKPSNGGWASVGIPRIVALQVLNAMGLTGLNHLQVTQFALNDYGKTHLTPAYDYALATNFGPHSNYAKDISQAKGELRIVAGAEDELFDATKFASVFANAGKTVSVTLVPRTNHIGLTLNSEAIQAIQAIQATLSAVTTLK